MFFVSFVVINSYVFHTTVSDNQRENINRRHYKTLASSVKQKPHPAQGRRGASVRLVRDKHIRVFDAGKHRHQQADGGVEVTQGQHLGR